MKPSKRALLVEIKDFLKKELDLLSTRKLSNVNLETFHGFTNSLVARTEASEKLKKGSSYHQAKFLV